MLRITVALLAALLLVANPALAEHKEKKTKDKDAEATSNDPGSETSTEDPTEPSQDGSQSSESKEGKLICTPVGVQLTPPPPSAGVDKECLPPIYIQGILD